MKKLITLTILAFSLWGHAQNGITYQAVILNPNTEELPGVDNSRMPLVNQSICLEFKIINAASKVDYQETLTTRTDEFGMVNVVIGTGTRKAGLATQFKNINWDGTAKNLVVSFDSTGNCTQFIEISDQPFTYVPYALYAANAGATGSQGPTGPAGSNGLDGKTVLNGTTNPNANLGTNGDFYINTTTNSLFGPKANGLWGNGVPLVGPQGIQGPAGPQGIAGTNGTAGTNGLSAYQIWLNAGNTGTEAQFLTAIRGATGAQGSQGLQGPIGLTGATGPQGVAGTNGSNGTNGLSAYQIWLNAGNTGTEAQFLTALRGATGAQGPQGIQGLQGPIGFTGATGSQGLAGTNGTNGNNGLSAYQIWLNAGNTGTEGQFLTTLRGATGAQGIQGVTGTNGTNGTNGATWLSGTSTPSTNLGALNDFYINTTNGEYFKKTASNLWTQQGNLTGPAGAQGTSNSNLTSNSIYWFKSAGATNSYIENTIRWYGYIYSTGYSSNNDVTHDTSSGEISFTKAGVYKIEYYVPNSVDGSSLPNQEIQIQLLINSVWTTINNQTTSSSKSFHSDALIRTITPGDKIRIRIKGESFNISVVISQTGATGTQGIAGTNGTNGTNGVNGQDGLSAYQIWLNAGNTGTEAQFLTALRGATGAQGIQGTTGTQGIAGTNGTNGLDGKTVLNGTQNPTAGIGNNGDFYINTTTNTLFGPKTSGAWGSGVSLVGPQGAAGTNGKNTLVNTTTEAAGANCASGGTKIEVGLDANSNGVLDSGEVNSSLTKYVCNGTTGQPSLSTNVNFNLSNIFLLNNTTTYTVPSGKSARISQILANSSILSGDRIISVNGTPIYLGSTFEGTINQTDDRIMWTSFLVNGEFWLPSGTTISILSNTKIGFLSIQETETSNLVCYLVTNTVTVPNGKKWKISSILPNTNLNGMKDFVITINNSSVYVGASKSSAYYNAGASGNSYDILKNEIWLPEGSSISPGLNIYGISIIEY